MGDGWRPDAARVDGARLKEGAVWTLADAAGPSKLEYNTLDCGLTIGAKNCRSRPRARRQVGLRFLTERCDG